MLRLTLSTAVQPPKVLVTPSMMICGLAPGSNHGRSLTLLTAVVIMSEVSRRQRAAPRRCKEGPLDYSRPHHAPLPRELPVEIDIGPYPAPRLKVRRIHHGKGDVALAGGRPRGRRDAADLPAPGTPGIDERVVRGLGAFDIEPNEPAPRRPSVLLEERTPPGEMPLAEIDTPAEAQLERRARGSIAQRVRTGDEIDIGKEEACLDPRDVECARAYGSDRADAPSLHQRIPQTLGIRRVHPQLVAQIAGEPRAGGHHRRPGGSRPIRDPESTVLERRERLDALEPEGFQDPTGAGTLQRERRDVGGHFGNPDVEADARVEQPVELPFARAEPVFLLAQAKDGAVIDQTPGIIAPDRIGHPPRPHLRDAARDQPIEEARGVRARDAVLHHRCQVVERGAVTDRKVFLLDGAEDVDRAVA